jgi:hypothetical protein
MSRARVFECHKQFSESRESLKYDDRPGRPRTAVTDDDTKKMRDVIRKDRRLGVRAIAEEVNLHRKSIRQILRKELNMRKLCAKMVPKLLSAVSTLKETVLKAIVFDSLNLLNKKSYRHSLVFVFCVGPGMFEV